MTVNEGEVFVAGSDANTARDLLSRAAQAGLPASVVRVDPAGGFVVPEALYPPPKRRRTTKKAAPADPVGDDE